jgi:hypothetical protein
MSTATTAPTAAQPKPGLALILALLGLIGCTIAWDLPAGGYWIGMPLAAAALVLGLRSRAHADRIGRRMAVAAIALAAVEIPFTATWTVAG